MKKIMKKALSLALALVMMLTLAPMTAMAATGDMDTPATLPSVNGSTISTTLNDTYTSYYYEWKATANGVLTLEFGSEAAWVCEIINTTSGQLEKQSSSYDGVSSLAIAVVKDATYLIGVQDPNGGTTVEFVATFEAGAKLPGSEASAAIDITSKLVSNPLGQGAKEYYVIKGEANEEYSLVVSSRSSVATVYVVGENNAEAEVYADADTGVTTAEITADANGNIVFAIQNVGRSWNPAVFNVECKVAGEDVPPTSTVGTMDDPYVVTTLGTMTGTCTSSPYWCKWTATAAGLFTITVDATEPAFGVYTVNDAWEYNSKATDYAESVEVKAGDVVLFYVRDFAAATVDFTTSFEAGATLPAEDEDLGGEEVVGPNYEWGDAIVVGENALAGPQDWTHFYTVHEFAPGKVGVYTFTTEDSLMGIVSTNGMWINVGNPGEEYDPDNVPELMITEKEIIWECTAVEQAIWLGVFPEMLDSNITVTWEELEVEEIPYTNVAPSVSIEAYSFKGEVSNLENLMYALADGEVVALEGKDGYYHVIPADEVDENGEYVGKKTIEDYPIVLVKLNDDVVSLETAIGYGNVKYVEYSYDEEDNPHPEHIYYFNDMITAYLECSATDAKLYPYTEDLSDIIYFAGMDQGWFEEGGPVYEAYKNDGVGEFMPCFALYYLNEDITTLDKEEPVVDKTEMADIIANNKDAATTLNTVTKNEAGEEVVVTFTFAAGSMKPVAGKEEYNFGVELVETFDKAELDKVEVKKEAFVLKVNFEYDGELPGEATIYIPVPATYINKTLYYYQVMEDGTLVYVCDAPVDAAGNAKVTQDHCSDYVLLTEKIPAEAAKTGDATNFALWIAVLGLGVVAIAGSVVMKKREF